jgi:hypothetical protein
VRQALFTNTIEASQALGVNPEYRLKLTAMRDKLLNPRIGPAKMDGNKAQAVASGPGSVAKVRLDYTNAKDRVWQSVPAEVSGKSVTVKLPAVRPIILYFNVIDERGLSIGNPHVELPPVAEP